MATDHSSPDVQRPARVAEYDIGFHDCGEHGSAMLRLVQFVKALARLLLTVSVVGATLQPFANMDGDDVGGLRAIRRPVAIPLTRALRLGDGMVLKSDGGRLDVAGRSNHLLGVPTATIGISPPRLNGALISQAGFSPHFTSRISAPHRGPPPTI